MPSSVDPVSGVLPRVHAVLSAVAASGRHGARLKDLAEHTGIARPTVHRLLRDLIEVGYVGQLDDRRYALGPELFWLGLSAPSSFPALPTVRALADHLAHRVGDTVFVAMRVADGVRYVLRVEGDFPVQSRVVGVGDVKPFTSSYSGLALLATMPDDVKEAALCGLAADEVADSRPRDRLEPTMRRLLGDVDARGWLSGDELFVAGLNGVAAPVPNASGMPFAAVSISAPSSRMPPARAEQLGPVLVAAAKRMSDAVESAR